MDDMNHLRARAVVAAALASKSRDAEVRKLLIMVSEELEEEACKLEACHPANAKRRRALPDLSESFLPYSFGTD